MSSTKNLVLEVAQQSESTLAAFMRFVSAWEIPIVAIKSEMHYGMITYEKRQISAEEWAHHRNVAFPAVKSTYVLQVNPEQEKAAREWVRMRNMYGKKFWAVAE